MTHDEMIAIIKHHQKGGLLESRPRHSIGVAWSPVSIPVWDFNRYEYRPKKEPVVVWGVVWNDGRVSPCFFNERAGAEDYVEDWDARVIKLVEVEE